MRGKLQTVLTIVILMMSLLGNAIANMKSVNASASYGDQFITVAELLDEDGNPATTVDQYATTQAHYEFKIPDNQVINAGDTMTVKLPSQLVVAGTPTFDIKDAQGNVIAHAIVNKVTGEVVITFTDFFETHQTNKQGSFNIWTAWDHSQINVDTDVPLDWGSQGTSTIHIGSDDNSVDPNEKLYKWGNVDPDDPSVVHWTARLNYKCETIKNAVVTDTIGPNQKLITSSIDAKYVKYEIGNNYTVTGPVTSDKINVLNDKSFEINFGSLNETVLIFYDTQTTDNGASATYSNNIQLKGDGTEAATVDVNTPNTGGGGTGGGDNQSVILKKQAAENKQLLLADAHFRLETKYGQVVKSDVVTDASGQLKVIGLPVGQYQFVEIKAPAGYQLDPTPVSFEIIANQSSAVTVIKTDQAILGSVTLTKKDSQDSLALKGAIFELQDSQGNQLQSNLITDDNGQLTVNSLTLGNYQLVETQAPVGYQLDKTPVKFTISQNQTKVNVVMTNKLIPGSVILTKQDNQDGSTLQGAVFELQDAKGKVLRNGLTTDASGQLAVRDLIPGEYAFVETKAPTGYELDKKPVKFTIKKGQTSALKVVKTNKLIPGSVILTKQDNQDGSTLQGAVFELQDAKGKVLRNGLTTDASGQLAVRDLIPGEYAFVETKAPTGYELDKKPVKFTIKKGQTSALKVVKTNKLIPGSVILTKQDNQDGSALQGALFELHNAKGQTIQSNLITNTSGQLAVEDLVPGTYYFVETKAPTGYELDKTPVKFTIKKGQTSAIKVVKTDKLIPGSVILTKQDNQDGSTLQGAVFKLQDTKGKVLQSSLTTDSTGQVVVKDLAPGDYVFVETKAPTGYELDKTPVKFTIKKGQTSAVKVVKTDKMLEGSVVLTKQDDQTGAALAGAVFKIVDEYQRVVQAKLTSNQAGQIIVTDLAPGNYSFVETKAPTGYILDQTPVKFTIKAQQKAIQVHKENRQDKHEVRLEKRDQQTNQLLAGAVFKLVNQNGMVINQNLQTDASGVLLLKDLAAGQYQLIETKAPVGYRLDQKPISFVVNQNQTGLTLVKYNQADQLTTSGNPKHNQPGFKLPQTGVTASKWALILGTILLIVIGLIAWQKNRKKLI